MRCSTKESQRRKVVQTKICYCGKCHLKAENESPRKVFGVLRFAKPPFSKRVKAFDKTVKVWHWETAQALIGGLEFR